MNEEMEKVGKIVFTDPSKESEWEKLTVAEKAYITNHLSDVTKEMANKVSIEILCHVINDLIDRINKLEDQQLTQNPKKGCVMCGGPTELCQICGARNR